MINFAWQQIPNTTVSEILCNTGFDGIILDAEHSSFTKKDLFKCIQVINLAGKYSGVRFTSPEPGLVRCCLDAGIDYAIFSTVDSTDYCEKIVNMCNYPKYGGKRGQGLVRENMWGLKSLNQKKVKTVAMIETKKGIDNLFKIKDYNIDYFLIGMYDLSASLGCIGDFENKLFKKYITQFKKSISKSKAGIHFVRNYDEVLKSKYIDQEFSFLALGMDTTVLLDEYKKIYEKIMLGETIE